MLDLFCSLVYITENIKLYNSEQNNEIVMPRPSKFDRGQAVETVMQELWRNGFEATSVKAVSEQLGITRSSYYNAFESREALFREALGVYAEQSPDRAFGAPPEDMSFRELVTRTYREMCRARAGDTEGRGCLAINSVTELVNSHGELGPFLTEAIKGSLQRLENLVAAAVEDGELPSDADAHALALSLQNLMIGINVMCKVVREEAELWRTAETTLRGLGLLDEEAVDLPPVV